ncbi:MAG: pantoate--beta-alanine ligase [Paracoccaceae bacterium]
MAEILRTVADLRARVAGWKAAGAVVGVVPTMGALHDGHLSLARAARAGADRVIVTIFVNPKQFNNPEDLKKYPRTIEADAALLDTVGVDVIFAPDVDQVYPPGFATTVSVSGVSEPLEGVHRPGHFDGMATVVAKLFGMTRADRAWFGQKDWQQLQVVRRFVADLNLTVEIVGAETVRDADGLALSSRNARLSEVARGIAPSLYWAMVSAAADIRDGEPVDEVLDEAREAVLGAGFDKVEYLDLRTAGMLEPMARFDGPARLLAAAWLDGVRLIDNIPV